jgi:hypothetical protein
MMFFHLPVIILSLVIIVDYIYTIQLEIKDTRCLTTGRWFSPGTPVSSNNKSDAMHDIAEILLKVVLNPINQTKPINDTRDTATY